MNTFGRAPVGKPKDNNMEKSWQEIISSTISQKRDRFKTIGKEIWSHPELPFEEFKAHNFLTKFLAEEGFKVEQNYVSQTGFRAVFTNLTDVNNGDSSASGDSNTERANVCLLCEYDAIPSLGHGAGHNLVSEASIAAAVAIKACLQEKVLSGTVTILGTPAEDCGTGTKIDMVNMGAFDNINVALMCSPMNDHILYPKHYILVTGKVTYKGKAAHASAYPWEGRNALDAAVACYNNIALLRQQLKPTWMINGIISKGGVQPNVIPHEAELKFWLRAPSHKDIIKIQQKCTACFVAAGKATGCEADFSFGDKQYMPMQHNEFLGSIYEKHAKELGVTFTTDPEYLMAHTGSTDMGNVSMHVPCISPAFSINTRAVKNSVAFHEAAGTEEAHEGTLLAAHALALTAGEVIREPELISNIRAEYSIQKSTSGQNLLIQKDRQMSLTIHHDE